MATDARAAELLALWERHIETEFAEKSADAAVDTMIEGACVNHVPTMTGGIGIEALRHFYGNHFINNMPSDVKLSPIQRTVGKNAEGGEVLVDEFIFSFTHSVPMHWMLPGVAPTGKPVSVAFIVVVNFQGDKLSSERIYWDQATVLKQLGLLPDLSYVPGAEQAQKALNVMSCPSNAFIPK